MRTQAAKRYALITCLGISAFVFNNLAMAASCVGTDGRTYHYSHPMCSENAPDMSKEGLKNKPSTEKYIVLDNAPGCKSQERFKAMMLASQEGGGAEFKREIMRTLISGECKMFKRGQRVYITDTAMFSGMVQIRARGEVYKYWTGLKAID